MFCFGSVPVFLRRFSIYLDLWTVNAVRYSTAALFWLPFVLVLSRRLRPGRPAPPARSIWRAALIPAAINTVGQVGWAAAPYFVDASTIAFVIRTSFLFTIVLGFLFIPAERALARRPVFYVGALVSVVGVVMMFAGKISIGQTHLKELAGLAILLGTAFCWGGYAVSVRRHLAGYPLRLSCGVISLYTTAVLVVLMLILGGQARGAEPPSTLWLLVVASGMIGVAFGHVLYYRGIHGIGPVITSGVNLGSPFVTCLIASFFPGEGITALQFAGGVTVVAGGAVLVLAQGRAEQPPAELPPPGR